MGKDNSYFNTGVFAVFMLSALLFNPSSSHAQLKAPGEWNVKTGISSYHINSLPEFEQAIDFATEIGYRMHTGFDIGLGYSMAWVKTKYDFGSEYGNFAELDGQEIHHAIRFMVGYRIILDRQHRHLLNFGTGAFILGEQSLSYEVVPTAIAEAPGGELFFQYEVVQYKQDQLFHIAGVLFNTDYIYRFHENLALGLRLEGNFLFDYGFDRYSFGPKIVTFF